MPPVKSSAAKPKKAAKPKSTSKKKAVAAAAPKLEDVEADASANGKSLVIVESPSKAKTIKKILGAHFIIKASVGHVRDLPEKKLGVDIDHNFEPTYEVSPKKADVVKELRSLAKGADTVYLASDPDREGEAIAWHIACLLDKAPNDIHRIEFHEITKSAILEAINAPRQLDLGKVNAQQARRILDRLVGYKLSPLLWKKVTKGLSAGRVQSVAVRIVCDREDEIKAFISVEYWRIHCNLTHPSLPPAITLEAEVTKVDGQRVGADSSVLRTEADTTAVVEAIKTATITVEKVATRESHKNPLPPFITSTLQREANSRYGYTVKRTMQIAQQLYEGITLGPQGPVGLITYMRTDSVRLADEALEQVRGYISNQFGPQYLPDTPRFYKQGKKGNVQDAHEAIRPTDVSRTPASMRSYLSDEQYRLYKSIWDRFVACQMAPAHIATKSVEMSAAQCLLRIARSVTLFNGYRAVYQTEEDDAEAEHGVLTAEHLSILEKGQILTLKAITPTQHFTEPPARYSEATLVKVMEELGIGRPSTYAPTIATIIDRGYVIKEEKALKPTPLGDTVNTVLKEHFKDIVDTHFTANLEDKLDSIEHDKQDWQGIVGQFYAPFDVALKKAGQDMEKVHVFIEGESCPDCGKPMTLKTSRFGSQFLGCIGYPDCKYTKPLGKDQKPLPEDKPSDERCDKCQGPMVIRTGPYGEYLACLDKETCKGKRPIIKKTGVACPKCKEEERDGELIERKSRFGKFFYGCHQYPACNFVVWNKPIDRFCPDCKSLLVEKTLKKGTFHACSNTKVCKYSELVT